MKFWHSLFPLFMLFSISSFNTHPDVQLVKRDYCTEIGVFNLIFDKDEVAGSYSLNFKNALGAITGKLDNHQMNGRWIDADGEGDIILIFDQDWSFFTANYRNDKEPEKWYTDQWHGALKPDGQDQFRVKNIQFKCQ